VGIVVTLELEGDVLTVADASGGDGTAAGDFDRLLPFAETFPSSSRIDPEGEVQFSAPGSPWTGSG
jgi:hypothetical protein